jgi:hypothetical protein
VSDPTPPAGKPPRGPAHRPTGSQRHDPPAAPPRKRFGTARDLALMFAAFVLASALAGALGAINLGTALAFGQIAFALTTVYVILRH